MVYNFKTFEDNDDLKEIFQDLELDYPELVISVSDDKYTGIVKIDGVKMDLPFANCLCDYINRCFSFSFKSRNMICIGYSTYNQFEWEWCSH